jgi:Ribbon-helix-helix domain
MACGARIAHPSGTSDEAGPASDGTLRDIGSAGGPAPVRHEGAAMSRPVKRSFTIAGHRTSISLEAAFWDALKDIAAAVGFRSPG